VTRAIFIAGLPGSGKSYYARQLASEINAVLFDDFKAYAIGDCSHFPFARSFIGLINELRAGKDSIICDIDFCETESRDEAQLCVEQLVPDVKKYHIRLSAKFLFIRIENFVNNMRFDPGIVICHRPTTNIGFVPDFVGRSMVTIYYGKSILGRIKIFRFGTNLNED